MAVACLVIILKVFRKWAKKSGEIYYEYTAEVNKVLLQAFQGIKEVLVMGRQKFFVDKYHEKYAKRQKGVVGQALSNEAPAYLIEGMCVSGLLLMVCVKVGDANDTTMLISQLATFVVAAFRILPSLGRISLYFNQMVFSLPGVNATYDNFIKVRSIDNMKAEIIEKREEVVGEFKSILKIQDVSWRYDGNVEDTLNDVNIRIQKGESVAFVGASGSGKTTLSDVILGLLTPQGGKVLVDGVDIRELKTSWCRMIGFVPQNAFLMDDTIRNNIAFGIKEDEIDDNMVWKALEQAQLKTFVEKLPNGLDTWIGERGVRFSGGQRQRVVISRALYYNPDILILDEATSALDTETETAVMEAIENLQGTKTLIIIAHRLTTIQHCDTIYRIEEGKAKKCKYEELV